MKLEAWSDTNIGLIRKSNQDAVGCFPEIPLFLVADGMGGRAEGEVAAHMAVDVIRDFFASNLNDPNHPSAPAPAPAQGGFWRRLIGKLLGPPAQNERKASAGAEEHRSRLRSAIELANRRIFETGQERARAGEGSMGTTVVVLDCALDQRRVYWAYVGDSRLYRVRNGELTLLTADHTLFGEAFWNQPQVPPDLPHTNRLVRALGILPEVEVSDGAGEIEVNDLFLLCSDGVSAMVKPDALLAGLTANASIEDAGKLLIAKALEAGGRDNATLLLVRVREG
jgi:protein phosphatase